MPRFYRRGRRNYRRSAFRRRRRQTRRGRIPLRFARRRYLTSSTKHILGRMRRWGNRFKRRGRGRGSVRYTSQIKATNEKGINISFKRGVRRFPRASHTFRQHLRAATAEKHYLELRGAQNLLNINTSKTPIIFGLDYSAYDISCIAQYAIDIQGSTGVVPGSITQYYNNPVSIAKLGLFCQISNATNMPIRLRYSIFIAKRDMPMIASYTTASPTTATTSTAPPLAMSFTSQYQTYYPPTVFIDNQVSATPNTDVNQFDTNHMWNTPLVKYYYKHVSSKVVTIEPNCEVPISCEWTPKMKVLPQLFFKGMPNMNLAVDNPAAVVNGMYSWKGLNDRVIIMEVMGIHVVDLSATGLSAAKASFKWQKKMTFNMLPYHAQTRATYDIASNGGDATDTSMQLWHKPIYAADSANSL